MFVKPYRRHADEKSLIWTVRNQFIQTNFLYSCDCLQVSAPAREEFTADRLTPGKKYKFRVKAINREGESEPLENDEPILARNPYGESEPLENDEPILARNSYGESEPLDRTLMVSLNNGYYI